MRFPDFETRFADNLYVQKAKHRLFYHIIMKHQPCIFWNSESKQCTIYEIRPSICREYPIHLIGFETFEYFKPFDQRNIAKAKFFIVLCDPKRILTLNNKDIQQE